MSYRANREKNSDENNAVRRYRADSNKPGATFSKLSWNIFLKSSYIRRFRNAKELFLSEFSNAFFAFPKKFFFSYLCRLVQPIRCAHTDHVM